VNTPVQQKLADGGPVFGWAAWLISHIEQVNGILQFLLLTVSIVATIIAARYHWKKTPK
jgi:hypothetical protein